MKKMLLLFIMIFLITSGAYSQAKIDFGAEYVSRYIWRGFDLTPDNSPNIQPWVNFSFKSGFNFNIWASTPLKNREANDNYLEMDLTLSYSKSLSKVVDFSAGLIYYALTHMDGFPDDKSTTPEFFVSVGNSVLPFSPKISAFYDTNLGDGIYIMVSGSKGIPAIPLFNLEVSAGLMDMFGVSGISDLNIGISKELDIAGYSVCPRVVFTLIPDSDVNSSNSEFWFGVSLAKK
ncbi:TorF family putative porin [candidate division KSB1 bacterium]